MLGRKKLLLLAVVMALVAMSALLVVAGSTPCDIYWWNPCWQWLENQCVYVCY